MAFAKFQENRFKIDGEIAENHAIPVNLTMINQDRMIFDDFSVNFEPISLHLPCNKILELV